jgi:DNA methylase
MIEKVQIKDATLYLADCRTVLPTLGPVDAIVTDPPYELGFMGKKWDESGIAYDPAVWRECLRVLKPGGHLLAFGGSRTYHRLACAIEDAGFEIRDQIMWLYGSGFPKSLDVSKAIDKAAGVEGRYGEPKSAAHAGWIDRGRMRGEDGHEGYQRPWMEDAEAVDRNARKYISGTEAGRQWDGWGTALKPAHEPIVVARKPLIGTVAENVLQHGTGALNIDGCRVGETRGVPVSHSKADSEIGAIGISGKRLPDELDANMGRWPANVILSLPEDEYELKVDTTPEQRKELLKWMYENA